MKCPNCHFENPDGLVFCGKCRGKLEKVCPKCNFSNPFDFMYCGKCGNNLEKLQAAPPLDYSKPKSCTPRFLADKITEKVSKRLAEDGVIELLPRKLV